MFIWRLETKSGKGYYDQSYTVTSKYQKHPTINCGLSAGRFIYCGDDRRYGFRSVQQMREWFFDPQDTAQWDSTLDLIVYKREACSNIQERNKQLVFKPGGTRGVLLPSLIHAVSAKTLHQLAREATS